MQVRMMQVWRQSPMIWLFAATFALTFALVNRGQEHRSSVAVGATGLPSEDWNQIMNHYPAQPVSA